MSQNSLHKIRTAKKIQRAAVILAVQDGIGSLTAEAIAREAGISTRTFFNYYPYKEAALLGPQNDFPAHAGNTFIAGRGNLIDDLTKLIRRHLQPYIHGREHLAHVLRFCESDPKMAALLQSMIVARRAEMSRLLAGRMPTMQRLELEILAAAIIAATGIALMDWTKRAEPDLMAAVARNLKAIPRAVSTLSASNQHLPR